MKRKHAAVVSQIFAHPVSGSIKCADIEALFLAMGAEIEGREGSRVCVFPFGEISIFHKPHPAPTTDKSAIVSIRKWLEKHGVRP